MTLLECLPFYMHRMRLCYQALKPLHIRQLIYRYTINSALFNNHIKLCKVQLIETCKYKYIKSLFDLASFEEAIGLTDICVLKNVPITNSIQNENTTLLFFKIHWALQVTPNSHEQFNFSLRYSRSELQIFDTSNA